MSFTWQDLLVMVAVVAAVVFLLRRFFGMGSRNKPTGCGSCSGCSAGPTDQSLIPIDPPRRTRDS